MVTDAHSLISNRTVLTLTTVFLLLSSVSFSQPVSFGLEVSAGIVRQEGNFEQFPEFPYRPGSYRHGNGWLAAAGILAEYPLLPSLALQATAGVGYHTSQWLKQQETTGILNGNPARITIEHTLQSSEFRGYGQLRFLVALLRRLQLAFGTTVFIPLQNSFLQKEHIVQPAGATFVYTNTDTQVLEEKKSTVPHPFWGMSVGIQIPLDLFGWGRSLKSQIGAFASIASPWQSVEVREFRSAVAIVFPFAPTHPSKVLIRDTVWVQDTVVVTDPHITHPSVMLDTIFTSVQRIETDTATLEHIRITQQFKKVQPEIRPFLAASLHTTFVQEDGTETTTAVLTLEEFISTQYVPLLNFLFFNLKEAEIPERYQRLQPEQTHRFSIKAPIFQTPMDVYWNMLNIVGFRLRRIPDARIRIVGCNAGEKENEDLTLSRNRAEVIRNYLQQVWGIAAERIQVQARNLPERPSPLTLQETIEENARAEIWADYSEIFAPIVLHDTVTAVDPPTIRFYPRIISEAGIQSWELKVWQNDRILFRQTGQSQPPEVLDWSVNQQSIPIVADEPLQYALTVQDSAGQVFITPIRKIAFLQRRLQHKVLHMEGNRVVEQYTLLLFDFNSAELKPEHRQYLDAIRERIPKGAEVTVIGTTDTVGNEQHNEKLALRRAEAVSQYLGLQHIRIQSLGEVVGDYRYPEQRFYQRTVHIRVEYLLPPKK